MAIGISVLVVIVAALGSYLCARNAYVGVRRGTVLVRSAKYTRNESPIYYFIGTALSVLTSLLMFAVLLGGAYFLLLFIFVRR